jgi:hypothetical protein
MLVLLGIVAALYERERSGLGQVIDAAMVDGVSILSQIGMLSPIAYEQSLNAAAQAPCPLFGGNLTLGDVRNELRYVSAWLDQELTILEGAE